MIRYSSRPTPEAGRGAARGTGKALGQTDSVTHFCPLGRGKYQARSRRWPCQVYELDLAQRFFQPSGSSKGMRV
jgi:hypothetical protein